MKAEGTEAKRIKHVDQKCKAESAARVEKEQLVESVNIVLGIMALVVREKL